MEPAMFSASHLFDAGEEEEEGTCFVEREHRFPGMVQCVLAQQDLRIREFSFHQVNANLLWPGSIVFAQWLVDHEEMLKGRRVLELGSGTGGLAIFLKKRLQVEVTTCDFDDEEVEENIAYNFWANGETPVAHIRHTWGECFPVEEPDWDVIIASDILLYVKQYPKLIETLQQVMRSGGGGEKKKPYLLMSWRRRIGKEEEAVFGRLCAGCGMDVTHLGSRVYTVRYP